MASLTGPLFKKLPLVTTEGNEIDNAQMLEVIYQNTTTNELLLREHGNEPRFARRCTHISPFYNCHGMTFASRRTGIFENSALAQILEEDKYVMIPTEQVLPGDVILYMAANGDIEHSGIVVEPPTEKNLNIPLVFSKWGRYLEAVHLANRCPYSAERIRYYRVNHGEFKNS